jgi:hypothetical protein
MTAAARSDRPDLTASQVEALTVAMVVAPGVYARNRMFELLSSPGARRARSRAASIRGVVRQLARASGLTVTTETRGVETLFVVRYVIPAVRLTRVVELSAAELAALRLVAERAGIPAPPPEEADRGVVAAALARLLESDLLGDPNAAVARNRGGEILRLARDIASSPPPKTPG